MNFDESIERRGTHSAKWDLIETLHGVSPKDGISMWTADMDFRSPQCATDALQKMVDHGIYGYYGPDTDYRAAIQWWLKNRHGWEIEPDWIFSAHGTVNGASMCVETWTEPGDTIIMFSPIYYVFYKVFEAADRKILECPMPQENGRYVMDFDLAQSLLTGNEKMLVLCSPHNPGGQVWKPEELQQLADFCVKNDLLLVSDEIHADLVFPGHKHTVMSLAAPEIADRLIMLTGGTKTFNLAGIHTGNVIIQDEELRAQFTKKMTAMGISPNAFGMHIATAVFSPEGAEWLDALMLYLDENRNIFDAGIRKIPGAKSMLLEGTYLPWVDFTDTGMSAEDVLKRVRNDARIACGVGEVFGTGAREFVRFNIATQRSFVVEAINRLQAAFADMQ
jgi:cysteine-S-conjugate beta-lyase